MSKMIINVATTAIISMLLISFPASVISWVSTAADVAECDEQAQTGYNFSYYHCCPVIGAFNISDDYIDLCAVDPEDSSSSSSEPISDSNSTSTEPDSSTNSTDPSTNSTVVPPSTNTTIPPVEPDPATNTTVPVEPDGNNDNSTVIQPNNTNTSPGPAVAAEPTIVRRRMRKTHIDIQGIESGTSTVIITSPTDIDAAMVDDL